MKKIILLLSFLTTMAIAPLAHASYAPLCVSYDSQGSCRSTPCTAAEQAQNPPPCSVGPCQSAPDSPVCKDVAASSPNKNPVVATIGKAAKIISLMAGFIAVIIIVVSGINMITSGGNTESVATARKRLTGAIVGLVIASLAWVLSAFVLQIVS